MINTVKLPIATALLPHTGWGGGGQGIAYIIIKTVITFVCEFDAVAQFILGCLWWLECYSVISRSNFYWMWIIFFCFCRFLCSPCLNWPFHSPVNWPIPTYLTEGQIYIVHRFVCTDGNEWVFLIIMELDRSAACIEWGDVMGLKCFS